MNQRITQQQTNTNSETLEQQKSNSWTPMGPTKDRANLTETFMPEPSLSLMPIGVQLKRSAKVLTVIGFTTKHAVGHITFESRIKFCHSDVDRILKTFYGVCDTDNLVWEVSLLKFDFWC